MLKSRNEDFSTTVSNLKLAIFVYSYWKIHQSPMTCFSWLLTVYISIETMLFASCRLAICFIPTCSTYNGNQNFTLYVLLTLSNDQLFHKFVGNERLSTFFCKTSQLAKKWDAQVKKWFLKLSSHSNSKLVILCACILECIKVTEKVFPSYSEVWSVDIQCLSACLTRFFVPTYSIYKISQILLCKYASLTASND